MNKCGANDENDDDDENHEPKKKKKKIYVTQKLINTQNYSNLTEMYNSTQIQLCYLPVVLLFQARE